MLTQTLPPSPACYAAQWPTFTATVNNTARCFYSANALFFITDLLGHHDIPSFLPSTSPLLTHPAAWGAALLCHMCNNKWASRCFVHACILQGTCCKSLRRTLTRLWTFAEFSKNVYFIFYRRKKCWAFQSLTVVLILWATIRYLPWCKLDLNQQSIWDDIMFWDFVYRYSLILSRCCVFLVFKRLHHSKERSFFDLTSYRNPFNTCLHPRSHHIHITDDYSSGVSLC